MKKVIKDGFYKVCGMTAIVEDGYVCRVCVNEEKGLWGVPYIPCKNGGWDNAYKCLTLDALRARMNRGTVDFN